MKSVSEYSVSNTLEEGETKLIKVICLKRDMLMFILNPFLVMMTFGILGMFELQFMSLRKKILYVETDLNSATHFYVYNQDKSTIIVEKLKQTEQIPQIGFINRYLKYFFDEGKHQFIAQQPFFAQDQLTNKNLIQMAEKTLSNQEVGEKRQIYGSCEFQLPSMNYFTFLLKELARPFMIIYYFSLVMMVIQGNLLVGVIFGFSQIEIMTINFIIIYLGYRKLRSKFVEKQAVKVYREKNFQNPMIIDKSMLVPGDVIQIEDEMKIPCDCALIDGEVMINEANLTGESIPINKFSLKVQNPDQVFDLKTNKKNILIDGTQIVKIRAFNYPTPLGIVLRTGFASTKGQILRSVLFPPVVSFNFYLRAIKFMVIALLIYAPIFAVQICGQIYYQALI